MSLFPLWDRSFSVRSGFGYRDNVLLSHTHERASAFFAGGLEASAFRLAEDGTLLNFLATGHNIHYFSVPEVDDEWLASGQMELKKPFASEWQAIFTLEYYFQNQVLDVSATEVNLQTAEVEGHSIQFTPGVRRNVGAAGWLELSLPAARRIYADPLDSFWEGGPKLVFGHPYAENSEWTIGYSFLERAYDNRTTSTNEFVPAPALEFRQHKVELTSTHFWDEEHRWRTATRASYKRNEDNGTSYFDYHRFQLSEQLRFRSKRWEVVGEVRFGHYLFDTQTVSATDSAKRRLSEFTWHLRVESQLVKHLKAYADFEQEHNFSNQSIERYRVNTISGGLILEF